MPTISVQVVGLKELRRDLARVDPAVAKKLRKELLAAAKLVRDDARKRVPTGHSGTTAASIAAGTTQKGAYVSGGKQAVPWYGWLDFGTRTPISGRPRSVGPWKKSGKGPKQGRFIYPALQAKSEQITGHVRTAVDEALNSVDL